MRLIKSLDELEAVLSEADAFAQVSDDALLNHLNSFKFDLLPNAEVDPYSERYRISQMACYEQVSGSRYSLENEAHPFDVEKAVVTPFPFSTGSSATIGAQFMAIGYVIKAMALQPGARVLELGPGWGNTTLALAQSGYEVTAIDIEQRFIDLIRARSSSIGVAVNLIRGDFFAIEQMTEVYDAVLFFESFHHCDDHLRLLKAAKARLKPGGKLVMAGEPVERSLPYPWGINPGGQALWSMRKYGWLELAFREDYFISALKIDDWDVVKYPCPLTAAGVTYIATRNCDTEFVTWGEPPYEFVLEESYRLETGHLRFQIEQLEKIASEVSDYTIRKNSSLMSFLRSLFRSDADRR